VKTKEIHKNTILKNINFNTDVDIKNNTNYNYHHHKNIFDKGFNIKYFI